VGDKFQTYRDVFSKAETAPQRGVFLDGLSPYEQMDRLTGSNSPSPPATNGYGDLRAILDEAYAQSAYGKGKERHANDLPWEQQPILTIARAAGVGFPVGQALKKLQEAVGMLNRGKPDAAVQEMLGAIVYAAAAIRYVRETANAPD